MMEEEALESEIQIVVLINHLNLISEVQPVYASDLGEPDCRLTKPCIIEKEKLTGGYTVKKWLGEYTKDEFVMISSDKILTIIQPKEYFINEYLKITK